MLDKYQSSSLLFRLIYKLSMRELSLTILMLFLDSILIFYEAYSKASWSRFVKTGYFSNIIQSDTFWLFTSELRVKQRNFIFAQSVSLQCVVLNVVLQTQFDIFHRKYEKVQSKYSENRQDLSQIKCPNLLLFLTALWANRQYILLFRCMAIGHWPPNKGCILPTSE